MRLGVRRVCHVGGAFDATLSRAALTSNLARVVQDVGFASIMLRRLRRAHTSDCHDLLAVANLPMRHKAHGDIQV